MKILVDIGHPAHVHYFRNLIGILEKEGVRFKVLARDKDVTHALLDAYGIKFTSKGKGGEGILDRIEYTVSSLIQLKRLIEEFKPDLCISHASPYLAFVASVMGVRHIMFNENERATFFRFIVRYFNSEVYTPESFIDGKNICYSKLPSYLRLAYLHKNHFSPDPNILEVTGDDYVLFRFVSRKALHDRAGMNLSEEFKVKLVTELRKFTNVWISSEGDLPDQLKPYKLTLPPHKMHDAIAYSSMLIGDSGSMSAEAAMLGVPSIFIYHYDLGYIKELQDKYGLIYHFESELCENLILQKCKVILSNPDRETVYHSRRDNMLSEKEDMTRLMLDIVNYN